jgi:two-component system, sensor histidine kinase and response regulator
MRDHQNAKSTMRMSDLSSFSSYSSGSILVVDDTPENLRLLMVVLTSEGYQVRPCVSGMRALAAAKMNPPDLILLDILMPEMDGYEVCQYLKSDDKTRHIPIIFLSALDEVFDKVKAFEMGGVDYITKPFQVQEALARVRTQLTLSQQQKQLHDQNFDLQKINRELSRSNEELEKFAYIVSHDLQQPLQGILGFAKILRMQYLDTLDREADRYVTRIIGAADRMQNLIENLLNYARVDTNCQLSPTDCNRVLEAAIANLQMAIFQQNACLIYGKLPIVQGNETQLIQLFQNTISNALKFDRPEVPLQIEISAELKGEQWLFCVRDNGRGIDPQHFDRIFQLFQRLDDRQTHGMGIGLATCKKIVDRHGGQIWVESQLGEGTAFYFTLAIA